MAKQSKSLGKVPVAKNAEGAKFTDTKPAATNPTKEQFAPTPAAPYRQRFRMAGGC
jgi:hypothetical protein